MVEERKNLVRIYLEYSYELRATADVLADRQYEHFETF